MKAAVAWSRSAGALVAADLGMKLSYTPLLTILLPMRMEALAHSAGVAAFSLTTLAGAVVASLSNVAVGMLSDRWRARVDRRAWVMAGLLALAASYAAMGAADTLWALAGALMGLQVAVNLILSPLTAMIAERYLHRPAGVAAGAAGLAQPLANLLGAALTGALVAFGPAPYAALALACAALILPFAWRRAAVAAPAAPTPVEEALAALALAAEPRPPGLRWLWGWRFGIALASTLSGPYLLFRLAATQGGGAASAAVEVSVLTGFSSLVHMAATLVTARAISRGLDRRLGAWLSAAAWMAAMGAFVFARGGWALVAAFALLGLAYGVQQTSDAQLWLGLLPARRSLGRDLGVLNLAFTLPQMLAPTLALMTPGVARGDVGGLFVIAAASAGVAGLAAIPLGVRRAPPSAVAMSQPARPLPRGPLPWRVPAAGRPHGRR